MELDVLPPRRPGRPFDSPCCGRGPLVSILAKGQVGEQVLTDKKEQRKLSFHCTVRKRSQYTPLCRGILVRYIYNLDNNAYNQLKSNV